MEVPAEIRRAMVAHALFCHPEEGCGLLAADEQGRLRMVYCLTNVDHSSVTYTLEPEEHFRALRHAEARGWHLAGVFHSHTESPAYPSPTDVARALEPDWLYVLVSLQDREAPVVRGFWIRDDRVAEEPLTERPGETVEVLQ
jgi:proteasome lid subunit RPN8/RPN11